MININVILQQFCGNKNQVTFTVIQLQVLSDIILKLYIHPNIKPDQNFLSSLHYMGSGVTFLAVISNIPSRSLF